MSSSGRVIGLILIAAGVILGLVISVWLLSGMSEGTLRGSGAIFGLLFALLVLVAPLVGSGIYFLTRGRSEEQATAGARRQRRLLDMVTTRGQLSVIDVSSELGMSRDQIESDIYDLVGLGLFTGYIDWRKGILRSVEAAQLQGRQTCPNCGGELELAGKGLIKCPYCGAEIFLGPGGAPAIAESRREAIAGEGSQR
jgi:hypothetical protein